MPNEIRIENFRDFVEKVQKLEADVKMLKNED